MSNAPAAAAGGAIGHLPSAKENFAATAAARELAPGPFTVPGAGPNPWTVSDLQLDRERWSSLCVSRGVDSVPALLQRLRRQMLQRRYTRHRRGGNSSFPTVPVVPGSSIDAESYFKALDAAKPSVGPFVVEGFGEWSLAELQLDKRQWSRLLSDRGVVSTPQELKKLRRKMKGRQYASKSSTCRKSPPPPSSSPQPDELLIDGLFDLAVDLTDLPDLGLDDASLDAGDLTAATTTYADGLRIAALAGDLAAHTAPSQPDELLIDGLFDLVVDLTELPDLGLDDASADALDLAGRNWD